MSMKTRFQMVIKKYFKPKKNTVWQEYFSGKEMI